MFSIPKSLTGNAIDCRSQYRQALTYLVQKEPFYYHFISQLRYTEVDNIGGGSSAAVAYMNNTFVLILDKNLYPTHDLEVAAAILCHETLHFIFQHLSSPFIQANATTWNWATDIAINTIMTYRLWEGALTADSVKKLLDIKEDFPAQKSALFYYSVLLKYKDALEKKTGGKGKGEPGEGEIVISFDNHDGWGALTPEEKKTATFRLARMTKDAMKKSNGKLPGNMKGAIEDLLKALEPLVDWRKPLRNWTGRCGGFELMQTNAKPNKYSHYPRTILLPGKRLLVAIDTSGSVCNKLLAQFFGELEAIAKYNEVDVMQVDWDIQGDVKPFKKGAIKAGHKVFGRGGTHMPRIFDWLNDHKREYDGIVILTDMGTAFPTKEQVKHRKVLWVDASGNDDWGWNHFPHNTGIGGILKLFDVEERNARKNQ